MSQTLFLKYRPQKFADLVGQTSVVKTLKNALAKNNPAHAYLFVGSRGTGKTSSARIFAKGLNSFDEKNQDVLENELTQQIADGDCVDIIEIDAASHTGVDNIRDLIDKVQFLPTYAKRKVYIIDEVHMLSKGAFNALLKTLEEPPQHAFFLLATTEMHKVPDTIISRCQTFVFGRFTIEQLVDRLQFICDEEQFEAEKPALAMIAKQAEGGLRDAISLLEQMAAETNGKITEESTRQSLGIAPQELLEKFWESIASQDTDGGLQVLKQLNTNGADFRTFTHDFLGFLREKMHESLNDFATLPLILQAIESMQKAILQLKSSPIVELPLEIALIELANRERFTAAVVSDPLPVAKITTTPPAPIKKAAAPVAPVSKTDKPVAAAAPTAVATPTPTIEVDTGDLSAGTVQSKMETISKVAGLATFVRKSFEKSAPQVVGANAINFSFTSSFHFEQVNKAENIGKIAKAVSEVFGRPIEVTASMGAASSAQAKSAPKETRTGPVSTDDFLDF